MDRNFECALFDMDGTLVDSTAIVEMEWTLWAQSKGIDPAVVLRNAHGRRTEDVIGEFLPGSFVHDEMPIFLQMASRLSQAGVKPISRGN